MATSTEANTAETIINEDTSERLTRTAEIESTISLTNKLLTGGSSSDERSTKSISSSESNIHYESRSEQTAESLLTSVPAQLTSDVPKHHDNVHSTTVAATTILSSQNNFSAASTTTNTTEISGTMFAKLSGEMNSSITNSLSVSDVNGSIDDTMDSTSVGTIELTSTQIVSSVTTKGFTTQTLTATTTGERTAPDIDMPAVEQRENKTLVIGTTTSYSRVSPVTVPNPTVSKTTVQTHPGPTILMALTRTHTASLHPSINGSSPVNTATSATFVNEDIQSGEASVSKALYIVPVVLGIGIIIVIMIAVVLLRIAPHRRKKRSPTKSKEEMPPGTSGIDENNAAKLQLLGKEFLLKPSSVCSAAYLSKGYQLMTGTNSTHNSPSTPMKSGESRDNANTHSITEDMLQVEEMNLMDFFEQQFPASNALTSTDTDTTTNSPATHVLSDTELTGGLLGTPAIPDSPRSSTTNTTDHSSTTPYSSILHAFFQSGNLSQLREQEHHQLEPTAATNRNLHDYDPVYVPTSCAASMNRLLDSSMYVRRPAALRHPSGIYEDIPGSSTRPPLPPRMKKAFLMGATASGGPPRFIPTPRQSVNLPSRTSVASNVSSHTYDEIQCVSASGRSSDVDIGLDTPVLPSSEEGLESEDEQGYAPVAPHDNGYAPIVPRADNGYAPIIPRLIPDNGYAPIVPRSDNGYAPIIPRLIPDNGYAPIVPRPRLENEYAPITPRPRPDNITYAQMPPGQRPNHVYARVRPREYNGVAPSTSRASLENVFAPVTSVPAPSLQGHLDHTENTCHDVVSAHLPMSTASAVSASNSTMQTAERHSQVSMDSTKDGLYEPIQF